MRAAIGDPKYIRTVTSIFGSSTPYTNDENTGWFKNGGDPEKAKQLFKEAGYAGETVVILQPTDWAEASNASQLLATTLRKIGVKAELVPSDWGGLVARRTNNGSVENGGWSIFMSDWADSLLGDPVGQPLLVANGEKGWFGWPKNDEYEAVRAKWPDSATFQERQALARKMQRRYWDFVGTVLLGGFTLPIAHRKTLTQLIGVPDHTVIWNMQKA
ncbi:MAG: ABC transporter substrate-binding protein, partial [Mesorhizobium sp.]